MIIGSFFQILSDSLIKAALTLTTLLATYWFVVMSVHLCLVLNQISFDKLSASIRQNLIISLRLCALAAVNAEGLVNFISHGLSGWRLCIIPWGPMFLLVWSRLTRIPTLSLGLNGFTLLLLPHSDVLECLSDGTWSGVWSYWKHASL